MKLSIKNCLALLFMFASCSVELEKSPDAEIKKLVITLDDKNYDVALENNPITVSLLEGQQVPSEFTVKELELSSEKAKSSTPIGGKVAIINDASELTITAEDGTNKMFTIAFKSSFLVSFEVFDGTAISRQIVSKGGKVQKPNFRPKRLNYSFRGYFKNEAYTTSFDFGTETITSNTIIYTKWLFPKVTIDADRKITGFKPIYEASTDLDIPSVIGNDSIKVIKTEAFANKLNLKRVTLENGLSVIEGQAFKGCNELTEVVLPVSITEIKGAAFYNCKKLTRIILPNSLKKIETGVFSGCIALTTMEIPNNVKEIGIQAFFNCTSLNRVILPNNLTVIMTQAFYKNKMRTLQLPATLKEIAQGAFLNSSEMTIITIPTSVTSIGHSAFSNSPKLTVTFLANTPPNIGTTVFGYSGVNVKKIIVPRGAKPQYVAATNWSAYTSIIEESN